jgi:hypothetical protein
MEKARSTGPPIAFRSSILYPRFIFLSLDLPRPIRYSTRPAICRGVFVLLEIIQVIYGT